MIGNVDDIYKLLDKYTKNYNDALNEINNMQSETNYLKETEKEEYNNTIFQIREMIGQYLTVISHLETALKLAIHNTFKKMDNKQFVVFQNNKAENAGTEKERVFLTKATREELEQYMYKINDSSKYKVYREIIKNANIIKPELRGQPARKSYGNTELSVGAVAEGLKISKKMDEICNFIGNHNESKNVSVAIVKDLVKEALPNYYKDIVNFNSLIEINNFFTNKNQILKEKIKEHKKRLVNPSKAAKTFQSFKNIDKNRKTVLAKNEINRTLDLTQNQLEELEHVYKLADDGFKPENLEEFTRKRR